MPLFIDTFLDRTTMYMLLVYYLSGLVLAATVLSAFHLLPYAPVDVITSTLFLVAVCWLVNACIAKIWRIPTNTESAVITGLILALIITPDSASSSYFFLLWAGVLAMASKYLVSIGGKHLFNPAAFAVVLTALVIGQSASWWAGGTLVLMPLVALGGVLVVRKVRRTDMVLSYLCAAVVSSLVPTLLTGGDVVHALTLIISHSPLIFFASVMITEPLTTPPQRMGRIAYGLFVGLLSGQWVHVGSIYGTPELALLVGNIFSYSLSSKFKTVMHLDRIERLAADTYEYIFTGTVPTFTPGQYAEWTIDSDTPDLRGNRRFFTLASSPTESTLRLGVKFYPNPSSYKTQLATFTKGSRMLVGSIAGDFVLPQSPTRSVVFIAGGIGVTPFRSMVQHALDTHTVRDTVLLYSNKSEDEIAYRQVFDTAQAAGIGFRAVYTLTNPDVPSTWRGSRGYVDRAMIQREVPDYASRLFYISGPPSMVRTFQKALSDMGVPRRNIHVDFFPGFA